MAGTFVTNHETWPVQHTLLRSLLNSRSSLFSCLRTQHHEKALTLPHPLTPPPQTPPTFTVSKHI